MEIYFLMMGVCIGLFVIAWAVVDKYTTIGAVIMSLVALVIPPFASIIANATSATDRRRLLSAVATVARGKLMQRDSGPHAHDDLADGGGH